MTKTKENKKLFNKVFWRSFLIQGSWNYISGQGIGILCMLTPFIKKIYPNPEDKPKRVEALKRHQTYINMTPAFSTFLVGILASMEEKNAELDDFDASSINAVKASLMGPLSGIGDSLFWVTIRVIAAGIGISLAKTGNILGPILFLILYNVPSFICRFYGTPLGYNIGGDFIEKSYKNGLIKVVTKAAGLLGMIMVGAMIVSTVPLKTPFVFKMGDMTFKLQEILDQILLSIIPLTLTLGCFFLVKRKVNPNKIIIILVVFSFVCSFLKILA